MTDAKPLTQGPIGRQLIGLALPLLLGNILQQFYNTVDAAIVGRFIGGEAFAAVGVAGSVMNLFLFLISGGCSGAGTLLSQLCGAGDERRFRQNFFLSAGFGMGVTVLIAGAASLFLKPLLRLLLTPADITPYAAEYLYVIFMGFPAAFAFHLCSAVLRALGNTQASLSFLALSMGINLGLDVLFVAGLEWGVAGAAWATVIAQLLASGSCVVYLCRRFPRFVFHRRDMIWDASLLCRTGKFAFAAALHMCSLYIGKLLVQRTVNSLGTAAITAFTAATRIEGFANSFGDSGSSAMSIFVGQNTGAGANERVKKGFQKGSQLLLAFGVFISITLLIAAEPCLALLLPSGSESSLTPALSYLRLVACFYTFNFLGSGLAGFFQGRGKVHIPTIGATSHITLRVILAILLAPVMGLPAVALACGLGWVFVVTFWTVLVRLEWKKI